MFVLCMSPPTFFCCKGPLKNKYKLFKNRKKQKYVNDFRKFYLNRYNLLLKIFVEKGIVDLIQMYLDELEFISDLKDQIVFRNWYIKSYNYSSNNVPNVFQIDSKNHY